jgi:long-chain acyl-CoA synthetase
MTETTAIATMNPSKGKKKLGTVGLPLINTDLKLVDPDTGQEVPLGEPGEICIKGPQIMQGYWKKPEETKNAFLSDGYMRTGDVAIFDEEGYLRIVDRTKDMIIVGGFKVFSSKVEDIMTKHPGINMISLIGVPNPDRPGSEFVKAYVVPDPEYPDSDNSEVFSQNIIDWSKENCAPYEVPKFIEIREELPLTMVGKVDKQILRKEQN